MQKKHYRQQAIQAQIQIDEFRQAVMIWLPAGFVFLAPVLHIFPKITLPI